MKPKPTMTESELLAAVLEATAEPADDPGVTVAEYAAANPGMTKAQADLRLRHGVETGKLLEGWAYRRDAHNAQRRRGRVYRPAG